ncbi:MAG: hypothetical protein K9L79_01430 [Methylobacter tundripaludum]|nr:hypothetical protein [Methylobacter tundripaludum]
MSQDIHLLLGEIKGKLEMVADSQDRMEQKFDGLSTRIGKVEARAAGHGMVTGAVAAVGIAFIKDKLGI